MRPLDRMTLAEIPNSGNPQAIAREVLRQIGELSLPINIEDVAYAAGITEIRLLQTQGFEGALLAPDHKQDGVILVNKDSRPQRRRFTVGHETGHLLNPWHKPPAGGFRCTKQDMFAPATGGTSRLRMEAEANVFSAEILMPEKLFRQDLRRLTTPGLEHIVDLAERKYATSKLATARRFVDLHDEASAVILSKDGLVEQIHRHQNFPFIELQRGQAVPRKALTATFGGSGDECSNSEGVEPSLWFSKPMRRGVEIFEQVLVQGGGYRMTLLTLDESESEDDDEEYGRERASWDPNFR